MGEPNWNNLSDRELRVLTAAHAHSSKIILLEILGIVRWLPYIITTTAIVIAALFFDWSHLPFFGVLKDLFR